MCLVTNVNALEGMDVDSEFFQFSCRSLRSSQCGPPGGSPTYKFCPIRCLDADGNSLPSSSDESGVSSHCRRFWMEPIDEAEWNSEDSMNNNIIINNNVNNK